MCVGVSMLQVLANSQSEFIVFVMILSFVSLKDKLENIFSENVCYLIHLYENLNYLN